MKLYSTLTFMVGVIITATFMKTIVLAKDVFLIEDFWSEERCRQYILKSEEKGYEAATVQTERGPRLVDVIVVPRIGSALIFHHYLEHEGSEVVEGTKYVLRTDIIYRLEKSE
jgi:hypothetical protein